MSYLSYMSYLCLADPSFLRCVRAWWCCHLAIGLRWSCILPNRACTGPSLLRCASMELLCGFTSTDFFTCAMQERRSAGVQECRSAGVQERRSAGGQERRRAGVECKSHSGLVQAVQFLLHGGLGIAIQIIDGPGAQASNRERNARRHARRHARKAAMFLSAEQNCHTQAGGSQRETSASASS